MENDQNEASKLLVNNTNRIPVWKETNADRRERESKRDRETERDCVRERQRERANIIIARRRRRGGKVMVKLRKRESAI